ncbi:MAG: shikimate kinase [Clostridia bacterium]|nr:shikimate kinase [Clostridia bacterium]
MKKSNIVLIGMPSSGKSTIGKQLADELKMAFIDTDEVLRQKVGAELRDVVKERGLEMFLKLQEEAVLGIQVENHVIATGGSAVYSKASMEHLRNNGVIIYLEYDYEDIEKRVTPDRRFARSGGQSLLDLFNERTPLYKENADIIVNGSGKSVEKIVKDIKIKLESK